MQKTFIHCFVIAFVFSGFSISSADVWQGPSITFTKAPGVDWTLPENQDQITPNVAITRANVRGIFNIAQESTYSLFSSPADTEWAFGTTNDDLGTLSFSNWQSWNNSSPPDMVGQDAVLHLISEDIFLDIRFTSWGEGAGAGGFFSYVRSTPLTTVPEPASIGFTLAAICGIVTRRRRR